MATLNGISFQDVFDFYQLAGFIYPAKRTRLEPYLPEVAETWRKLLGCPNDAFLYLYNTRNGAQSSSLCAAQYSGKTWLVQHAVGRHDSRGVLRNLLLLVDWLKNNPSCDFVRFLYRPTNKWPRLIFGGLMGKLDGDCYENHVYDYYTGSFDRERNLDMRPGLTIEYVVPADCEDFERELFRHQSPLFIGSKGLAQGEMSLEQTTAKYAEAGLVRERSILVARQEGKVIGYSLLDYSSLGINLSFLFNAFLVTMFHDDEHAARNLVAASINHYLQRGRTLVIGLSAGDTRRAFEHAGMRLEKQYAELTVSTSHTFAESVSFFTEYYQRRGRNIGDVCSVAHAVSYGT